MSKKQKQYELLLRAFHFMTAKTSLITLQKRNTNI